MTGKCELCEAEKSVRLVTYLHRSGDPRRGPVCRTCIPGSKEAPDPWLCCPISGVYVPRSQTVILEDCRLNDPTNITFAWKLESRHLRCRSCGQQFFVGSNDRYAARSEEAGLGNPYRAIEASFIAADDSSLGARIRSSDGSRPNGVLCPSCLRASRTPNKTTKPDRVKCIACGCTFNEPDAAGAAALNRDEWTDIQKSLRYWQGHSNTSMAKDWTEGFRYCPICLCELAAHEESYITRNASDFQNVESKVARRASGRTVGVELECEPTVRSLLTLPLWPHVQIKTDHSLRGPRPMEYVSPILYASSYERWLTELTMRLKGHVYNRAGLHIHLGTADMSWFDIANLSRYCKMHESEFFYLVSPSRVPRAGLETAGTPQVLPMELCGVFKTRKDFIGTLYGPEVAEHGVCTGRGSSPIKTSKRVNDRERSYPHGVLHRYQWLNIHGHFHKRAIEVRLHQGTLDFEKIRNWIALWLCLLPVIRDPKNIWISLFDLMPEDLRCYYQARARALHPGKSTVELPKRPPRRVAGRPPAVQQAPILNPFRMGLTIARPRTAPGPQVAVAQEPPETVGDVLERIPTLREDRPNIPIGPDLETLLPPRNRTAVGPGAMPDPPRGMAEEVQLRERERAEAVRAAIAAQAPAQTEAFERFRNQLLAQAPVTERWTVNALVQAQNTTA